MIGSNRIGSAKNRKVRPVEVEIAAIDARENLCVCVCVHARARARLCALWDVYA